MLGSSVRRAARIILALIRIVNGLIGLVVPQLFIARFDPDAKPSAAALYAFRLFGIRTVLIGLDLLGNGPHVPHAVRAAPSSTEAMSRRLSHWGCRARFLPPQRKSRRRSPR